MVGSTAPGSLANPNRWVDLPWCRCRGNFATNPPARAIPNENSSTHDAHWGLTDYEKIMYHLVC